MKHTQEIGSIVSSALKTPPPMLKLTQKALEEKHVMIDNETLSTKPNAGIYCIALRVFSLTEKVDTVKGIGDSLVVYIQPLDVLQEDRFDVTKETLKFTREKNLEEFCKAVTIGLSIRNAAVTIKEFLDKHNPSSLWSNDPSFDLCQLHNLFAVAGVDSEVLTFRKEQSVRTIRKTLARLGLKERSDYELGKKAHVALDDCDVQIEDVVRFYSLFKYEVA